MAMLHSIEEDLDDPINGCFDDWRDMGIRYNRASELLWDILQPVRGLFYIAFSLFLFLASVVILLIISIKFLLSSWREEVPFGGFGLGILIFIRGLAICVTSPFKILCKSILVFFSENIENQKEREIITTATRLRAAIIAVEKDCDFQEHCRRLIEAKMDNMMEEIIGRKCDKQDTSLNSSDIRSHFKEFDSQVASLEKLIHPTNRERAFFNYNKLYNSKLSRDHRCTRICEYGKTHEVSEKINLLLNELIPHTGREPEEDRFMHLEECDWRLMHTYLDLILPRSNARQKTIEEMLL
jgi:hypothetical protein